jgi:hypothetical protein
MVQKAPKGEKTSWKEVRNEKARKEVDKQGEKEMSTTNRLITPNHDILARSVNFFLLIYGRRIRTIHLLKSSPFSNIE